jgi:hypothetical protein
MQVRRELSCFCTFDVPLGEAKDPLLWWSIHEGRFSIVTYLTRMILGKHGN